MDLKLLSLKILLIGLLMCAVGFLFSLDFFNDFVEFVKANTWPFSLVLLLVLAQSAIIKWIFKLD
jgi:hypothetical protein